MGAPNADSDRPLPTPPLIAALLALTALSMLPAVAFGCDRKLAPGTDLQAAIDRIPANGKPFTLCLKAGEYALRKLVAIQRDGVTLRGAGPATVLRMAEGIAQPVLVIGDYTQQVPRREIRGVRIDKLTIVGAASAAHEFMPELPYLSNSAIVIRRGRDIHVSELTLSQCRSACVLSEHDSQDITIERNQISAAVWDGVSFNRSGRIRLIGNEIRDNVAAGITTEHLRDSEIRDNLVERNGSHGMYLSDSLHNRFENNRFIANRQAGVFLTCAVRFREPDPVLCWDRSMSQDNVFERNRFEKNPFSYAVGMDSAANCASPDFKPNFWRDNTADAPSIDPQPERFGRCVQP